MEIEVNEFVRTDNGIIGKYVKYRGIEDSIETNNKWIGFDIEKDIVKHSKNIIDLIEIGDILRVFDNLSETEEKVNIFDDEMLKAVKEDIKDNNYEILSILTHEQFSSLEYII